MTCVGRCYVKGIGTKLKKNINAKTVQPSSGLISKSMIVQNILKLIRSLRTKIKRDKKIDPLFKLA